MPEEQSLLRARAARICIGWIGLTPVIRRVQINDRSAQKADFAKFRVPNLTGPDGRKLFVEVRQYRLLAYLK